MSFSITVLTVPSLSITVLTVPSLSITVLTVPSLSITVLTVPSEDLSEGIKSKVYIYPSFIICYFGKKN